MLPKVIKITTIRSHMAVVKNINSVMENNARKSSIYKGLRAFSWLQFLGNYTSKKAFR
jgi:hypothetical protein